MPRDNAKASDVWVRYQYVRDNGHLDYVRKARQCEDFFSGLQWNPEDLSLLRAQRRHHRLRRQSRCACPACEASRPDPRPRSGSKTPVSLKTSTPVLRR